MTLLTLQLLSFPIMIVCCKTSLRSKNLLEEYCKEKNLIFHNAFNTKIYKKINLVGKEIWYEWQNTCTTLYEQEGLSWNYIADDFKRSRLYTENKWDPIKNEYIEGDYSLEEDYHELSEHKINIEMNIISKPKIPEGYIMISCGYTDINALEKEDLDFSSGFAYNVEIEKLFDINKLVFFIDDVSNLGQKRKILTKIKYGSWKLKGELFWGGNTISLDPVFLN